MSGMLKMTEYVNELIENDFNFNDGKSDERNELYSELCRSIAKDNQATSTYIMQRLAKYCEGDDNDEAS